MSDNTKIEWTDATAIVDRDGRRVRTYQRKDATRPGQQMRRRILARRIGKKAAGRMLDGRTHDEFPEAR